MKIYSHLSTFYELVVTMSFHLDDVKNVYMHLFSFSLARKGKEWLTSQPNQNLSSWRDVEEKFLHKFFPLSHYIKAKSETFMFRHDRDLK